MIYVFRMIIILDEGWFEGWFSVYLIKYIWSTWKIWIMNLRICILKMLENI